MKETNTNQERDEVFDGKELIPAELNAKTKKNLLSGFIFAVMMIFAGLTSGYIVSQGGNFWVNISMPSAFAISTIAIIASSGFLFLARYAVKKDNSNLVKYSLGAALALGIVFGVYQIKGWGELSEKGSRINGGIINSRGKYGKYFTLLNEGKEISYDNGTFFTKGAPVSDELMLKMQEFSKSLMAGAKAEDRIYQLANYGTQFSVRYDGKLMTLTNGQLQINGFNLSELQHNRLWFFAENIVEERGDFILKGKYGEDFFIYYGGEQLDYKNRTFFLDGQQLSPKLMDDLNNQRNTASSYIYAFTIMHLLHWIGGIIALLVMFIKGLRLKYTATDYLGITLGSRYWHFLGILWLYLYAFLIFIH